MVYLAENLQRAREVPEINSSSTLLVLNVIPLVDLLLLLSLFLLLFGSPLGFSLQLFILFTAFAAPSFSVPIGTGVKQARDQVCLAVVERVIDESTVTRLAIPLGAMMIKACKLWLILVVFGHGGRCQCVMGRSCGTDRVLDVGRFGGERRTVDWIKKKYAASE